LSIDQDFLYVENLPALHDCCEENGIVLHLTERELEELVGLLTN